VTRVAGAWPWAACGSGAGGGEPDGALPDNAARAIPLLLMHLSFSVRPSAEVAV
jgi:hypothetical protein